MADDDADGPDDAADEVAITAKRRRTRRRVNLAVEFWRDVFASEVGRAEMWKLLQDTHAFEERFACGPNGFPQTEATWFHAGEMAFGLRLYHSWLALDHAGVALMHSENDSRFPKK
jgi:hypothetical protein